MSSLFILRQYLYVATVPIEFLSFMKSVFPNLRFLPKDFNGAESKLLPMILLFFGVI